MGKPVGKKKPQQEAAQAKANAKQQHSFDEDTAVFISMSQELKEEGNKLFQRRDYETAMLRFEKAVKLLPKAHIDVATLRTSMASCYMQMGIGEYPRAIAECNLALQVAPKYTKALLRRAICFEALHRFDLAWTDVCLVLSMEPGNVLGLEVGDRLRRAMEEKGIEFDEVEIGRSAEKKAKAKKIEAENRVDSPDEVKYVEATTTPTTGIDGPSSDGAKYVKGKKLKTKRTEKEKGKKRRGPREEVKAEVEDKEVVVQEKVSVKEGRRLKLVFGKDIRWAEVPVNCSLVLLREVVLDRFPGLSGVLVKYRDGEGDDVTITTTEELRRAEACVASGGSLRLYVAEVGADQEPRYAVVGGGDGKGEKEVQKIEGSGGVDAWIYEFAQLFKSHVGVDSDAYLDLHGVGMRLYSEAVEDVVSTEDAQGLFNVASDKFQEMAALALFNWGNVHMSKAGKRVLASDDQQIKAAYDWSRKEYMKAGMRYEEALKIKPDFYEGFLALGQQQFEQAKLCWTYAVRNKVESEESSSSEVLQLFNKAEDNMETGMQMWEEMEERRLNGLSKEESYRPYLKKAGMDGLLRELSGNETSEQSKIMRAQVLILWGTLLYERSIIEFKLGLPTWEECLEVAVEKFELAGTSNTDIAVMVKNHCAHQAAQEGLGFRIDEIVQAWHDMYDAKRWLLGVPSFRLEPLFRRRVPRLQQVLEQHM